MGLPSTPSPPHLYSQAIQLKLYQAFIFSVPVLFSIILFLLFYLFYLKRRASSFFSSPANPPWRSNQATDPLPSTVHKKEELKAKLPMIMFDEDVRSRESQCSVCLGEFELKEQLHQIPSCNHVFHIDCIHHWLQANTTCPLCRGSIVLATNSRKSGSAQTSAPSSTGLNLQPRMDAEVEQNTQIEGSTNGRTRLITQSSDLQELSSVPIDINGTDNSPEDSVTVQIHQ